jgi:V-type H+-transporting ATPase subunit D
MAQANFAAGDFGVTVRDSVKTKTNVRVTISTENIAGVQQPTFHLRGLNEGDEDTMIGMTGGGQAIMKTKERFQRYLKLLIEIASLQTQFVTIERVIKVTNRRVNALEFVIIPQIEHTIKWIEGELDELDREDFYRLKCVQDKKKEAKELELKELKAKMAAARGDADAVDDGEEDNNLFKDEQGEWEEEDENDIIF